MDRRLDVIIIEDDDTLRTCYAEELTRLDSNIRVETAATIVEGARLARRHPQIVALVDLTLADAQETDAVIALNQSVPGAVIVVITGSSDPETARASIAAGAHKVIIKGSPESHGDRLITAIREAVHTRDMETMCAIPQARIDKIEGILQQVKQDSVCIEPKK